MAETVWFKHLWVAPWSIKTRWDSPVLNRPYPWSWNFKTILDLGCTHVENSLSMFQLPSWNIHHYKLNSYYLQYNFIETCKDFKENMLSFFLYWRPSLKTCSLRRGWFVPLFVLKISVTFKIHNGNDSKSWKLVILDDNKYILTNKGHISRKHKTKISFKVIIVHTENPHVILQVSKSAILVPKTALYYY